jgi:glycerol-3-phosphate acyltransferase PlsY
MIPLLIVAIAYLLGAIPFGFLLVRWTTGRDVRAMGSGNIGATNVLRTTGRTIAIVTLLLDIAKGVVAVWIADRWTQGSAGWMATAALAVMAGHAYPVFLKFKGGKAVATFIGAFLYLTPLPLFAVLIVFVVTVAVSRYISLGSILACGTFPLAVWMILHPHPSILGASIVAGAFIVWRHSANIQRLREGTEFVFSFKGRK